VSVWIKVVLETNNILNYYILLYHKSTNNVDIRQKL
jgi:hypothetical protein